MSDCLPPCLITEATVEKGTKTNWRDALFSLAFNEKVMVKVTSVDMFSFEKRISEITPDQTYLNNPVRTNNRMTVKELHAKSMNIQWLEILKAAYSDAQMNEDTEV